MDQQQFHKKYTELKKRKLNEAENQIASNRMEEEVKQAVGDLAASLKNQNETIYKKLYLYKEKSDENEALVLEQKKRIKELCDENERLRELLKEQEKLIEAANQSSTHGNLALMIRPASVHEESCVQHQNVNPCKRALEDDDSLSCMHTLLETAIGLTVEIDSQSREETCLCFSHERTGYKFTLTRENNGEFRYRLLSLGMLQNVAIYWMHDEIIFSMNMCRAFFSRVESVIGGGK